MYKKVGRNTIVLLGVGHTNAHVLKMWRMQPIPNSQLVCVSDFPVATYSGMLPAVLAGQNSVEDMEIDLVRLCNASGARLILGRVSGIDSAKKRLLFEDRPPLDYELLSIGVGSRPTFSGVAVDSDSILLPVKPMQTFLQRLESRLEKCSAEAPDRALRIAVVGGGIGSIEVTTCLNQRCKSQSRNVELTLVTGSQRIGSGTIDATAAKVMSFFQEQSISTLVGQRVARVTSEGLTLADDSNHPFDIVIWATSAVAGDLLKELDFEKDAKGFLLTRSTLQLKSNDQIFVVGDSGTLETSPTPKAGVYAVRQGPILWKNIKRKLKKQPLLDYKPQQGFLKLVNLGDGTAVAEYKGMAFRAGWCWGLKNRIDVKFMRMYQDYRPMEMKPVPVGDEPMKCLGCGGKVGGELLSQVISELEIPTHPDVKIGLENPDDAAVIRTHDNQVTVTTDFFAAPFDDPYLVGRIATLNSASDCFVMGAQPTSALAIVQLPLGHQRGQLQVMRELMAGSVEELGRMGATIVGGHTIEGPRTLIGYTILGRQLSDIRTKGLLQPGDQLVLSKPLGTGALMVGLMNSELPGRHYETLVESMLLSNQVALELNANFPISAMTDVTGFGLAGHLVEMLLSSQVSAKLDLEKIPLLPGCRELLNRGVESTLAPDNRLMASRLEFESSHTLESRELAVLFDPQTGGGLLFGVPAGHLESVVEFLKQQGFGHATRVGEVVAKTPVSLRVQ